MGGVILLLSRGRREIACYQQRNMDRKNDVVRFKDMMDKLAGL